MGLGALLDRYRDWRERRSVMAELREIKAVDDDYAFFENGVLIGRIVNASKQGRTGDALAAWDKLKSRNRALAITSRGALEHMIGAGLFDEVEAALNEAEAIYPDSDELAQRRAELAMHRGNLEEADRLWEAIRKQWPEIRRAYVQGAQTLVRMQRYDEADQLLEHELAISPDDRDMLVDYAGAAIMRGDFAMAYRRWEIVRDKFLRLEDWLQMARCLVAQDKLDDAIALLTRASRFYQGSWQTWAAMAEATYNAGRFQEALEYARITREYGKHAEVGYIIGSRAAHQLGLAEEEEKILLAAVSRDDTGSFPAVDYAYLAHRRGDWPEAVRRWDDVRLRFPERGEGYTMGAEALERVGEIDQARRIRAEFDTRPGQD